MAEKLDRGGEGMEEGGTGGSTVLGPHGRDSSKTCLRWPRRGLNQTGPLVGGAWWQWAVTGPCPRWSFSPLAFLCLNKEVNTIKPVKNPDATEDERRGHLLALSRSNSRSSSSSSVSLEKLSSPNGFQPDMSGGLAGDVTPSGASRGFLRWGQVSRSQLTFACLYFNPPLLGGYLAFAYEESTGEGPPI